MHFSPSNFSRTSPSKSWRRLIAIGLVLLIYVQGISVLAIESPSVLDDSVVSGNIPILIQLAPKMPSSTAILASDLSAVGRHAPAIAQQVVPREQQPAATQEAGPGEQQPAATRDAVPGEQQPAATQQTAPHEQQPAATQQTAPSEQQPAATQQAGPSEQQPTATQQTAPHEQQPAATQQTAPSEQQPAATQQAGPSEQQPAATQQAGPSVQQPAATQQAGPSVQQPAATQQAGPSEQQPAAQQQAGGPGEGTSTPAAPAGNPSGVTNVSGKISDLTGAAIPAAHVLLSKEGADHTRLEADSDSAGSYRLENLEPGRWNMTVSAPEMLSHTQAFDIASGESKSVNVQLEDLEPEDLMRITGKRTLIHPEKIGSRTNVPHETLYKYRSGNDIRQVIESTPGVVTDTFGNMIIRGEHNAANYVLDDVVLPEAAGVLQQSNFVTPRSLQSLDVDIGGYQASDGGGPLGAVVRMKSQPITERRTLTVGQQLGGPMAGNVYYNVSGAASLDQKSIWNRVRFNSSGNFVGTSLGLAPPVKLFAHNDRCDINSLTKIEFRATELDRLKLTVGLNNSFLQIPTSHVSYNAGVRQRQYDGQNFIVLSWKHQFERFFDECNLHLINAFYKEGYASRNVFDPNPIINGEQPLVSIQPNASRFNYVFGAQGNIIKTFLNTHRLEAGFLSEYRPVRTNFSAFYYNNDPTNPDVPYGALISPFTGLQGGPNFVNGLGQYKGSRYLQSAYFQDAWRPTTGILKRITLDAGVRADVYHGVFGNTQRVAQLLAAIPGVSPFLAEPFETQRVTNAQASGRFGGAIVLTPRMVLRGSFSNLFMPPPVDVLSTPPNIQDQVNGIFNGTVRPMSATRGCLADTSVEQQIGSRMMLRTNLYYKKLSNFGDSGVVGNSTLYNRLTLSGLESYGVENRMELKNSRDGFGWNGFLSNTVQVAYLRGSKMTNGGIYGEETEPVEDRFPDHDRRESLVAAIGYNGKRNWWAYTDYKMMTGLQDSRDPFLVGPHRARTPVLNIFGLNFGYKAPETFAAKRPWLPDTFDARFENLLNNRLATNLGSPFQGTRFLLPFRFLLGCSWHVGQQQYKLSQNSSPKEKEQFQL